MPYSRRRRVYRRRFRPYRRRRVFRTKSRRPIRTRRRTRRKFRAKSSPFPRVMKTIFTYANDGDYNFKEGTSVDLVPHTINLNNLNDCEPNMTTQLPRYFNTLLGPNNGTPPYSDYLVNACKVTITLTSPDYTGSTLPPEKSGYLYAWPISGSVQAISPSNISHDYLKSIPGVRFSRFQSMEGRSVAKVKLYQSIKRFFNVKDLKDEQDEYGGKYNVEPVIQPKIQWIYLPYNILALSEIAVGAYCTVRCKYYTMLSNRTIPELVLEA